MKVSDSLDDVPNGPIVLPDFQRSFMRDAEDIRQLLMSIVGDYVIGSILILEDWVEDSALKHIKCTKYLLAREVYYFDRRGDAYI